MKFFPLALMYGIASLGSWSHPVDQMELNAFYDAKGSYVFEQVILYDTNPATGKSEIRAWGLVGPGQNPYPYSINGTWFCSINGTKARSRVYVETYTQVDPEREQQKALPQTERFPLPQASNRKRD